MALQAFNKYQSDELNAQQSMMNGILGQVDMHVTRMGSHFHEEQAVLRSCESASAEQLARETRQRRILQS
eukprot:10376584-Prorocentrum_lima.AAC.1